MACLLLWGLSTISGPASASSEPVYPAQDALMQDARDALKRRDKARLDTLRQQAQRESHPLAPWVDYWAQGLRLVESTPSEIEAFYARWPGSYVEDRLRNDWLLELARRRDWANFRVEFPRFRMNDDRDVTCLSLIHI